MTMLPIEPTKKLGLVIDLDTVSYTHLTLPTTYHV